MDDAFGHWLAGFIDGEGCFLITARSERVRIWFVLGVRADERPILETIVEETGLGRVKYHKRAVGLAAPQLRWEVSHRDDLLAMVDLLDRYPLRAKKVRDYEIWREAILLRKSLGLPVTGRPKGGPVDWTPFIAIMERLRAGRAYVEAK